MTKKMDFNAAEKIVNDSKKKEINKNNDFNIAWTFMTSEYIKENIQLLANAHNVSIKEMVNKILMDAIVENEETLDMMKKFRQN